MASGIHINVVVKSIKNQECGANVNRGIIKKINIILNWKP